MNLVKRIFGGVIITAAVLLVSTQTALAAPVLDVTVTPGTVLFGGEAVYTVTIKNTATNTDKGYNLTIEADFGANAPKKVSLSSATVPASVDTLINDGKVSFINIKDLAGQETYTFELTVKLEDGSSVWEVFDTIENSITAFVSANPDGTGTVTTETSSATAPVMPIVLKEKRTVQSTGVEQATGVDDRPYHYEIEVVNNAKLPTNGVLVKDTLDDGIEVLALSYKINSGAYQACTNPSIVRDPATGKTDVSCEIATMQADDIAIVKIETGIRYDYFGTDNGGTNRVYNDTDGDPALGTPVEDKKVLDNTATLSTVGNTWSDSTLQSYSEYVAASSSVTAAYATIDKSVNITDAGNGSVANYTMTYSTSEYYNITENAALSSITIHDSLPDGLTYQSANPTPTTVGTKTVAGTELTWGPSVLDALTHSDQFTITMSAKVDNKWSNEGGQPIVAGDGIVNTVDSHGEWDDQVDTARENDITESEASAAFSTAVPAISKEVKDENGAWVDGTPQKTVGDEVEFRVRFNTANGTSPILSNIEMGDVVVTDWLPKGMTYINSSAISTYSNVAHFTDGGDPATVSTVAIGGLTGVKWNLGDVAKQGWWQGVFKAKVIDDATVQDGAVATNIWKMTGVNTDGDTYSDRDIAEVEYMLPHLVLQKDVDTAVTPDPIYPGATVAYKLTVQNTGNSPARKIVIEDTVDADLDGNDPTNIVVTGVNSSHYITSFDTNTRKFVITFDNTIEIPAGGALEVKYQVVITGTAGAGTGIYNKASVSYNTQQNPSTEGRQTDLTTNTNDDNTDDAWVQLPGLQIVKTTPSPNEYSIGDIIPYTLTVTVPANQVAYWPEIEDRFDKDGLEYVANSATLSGVSGTPNAIASFANSSEPVIDLNGNENTKLTWDLNNSIDNRNKTADYVFKLDFSAKYTGVEDNGTDWEFFQPTNNDIVENVADMKWNTVQTATRETNKLDGYGAPVKIKQPLLTLNKSVSPTGTVTGGQQLTYTLTITNTGTADAHNIVVDDNYSVYLENITNITPSVGSIATSSVDAGTHTFHAELDAATTLAQGATLTITYTADVVAGIGAGATIDNVADVDWTSNPAFDGYREYNDAKDGAYTADQDNATLGTPDVSFVKEATEQIRTIGEEFDYVLTATIPANMNAYDAQMTDSIPAGLEVLSTTPAATVNGQDVTFDMQDVAAQATDQMETFTIRVRVKDDGSAIGVPQSVLTNNASFTWNTLNDDASTSNTKNATADVNITEADPIITKDVNTATADINDTVTYTSVITNKASATAPLKHIVWSDAVPTGLVDVTIVSVTGAAAADYTAAMQSGPATSTITFNDTVEIAIGANITIVYTAKVSNASNTGDVLTNTASFTGSTLNDGDTVGQEYAGSDPATVTIANTSVGDFVWFDLDKDGVQDAGEPGIQGVLVHLLDAAGNAVDDPRNPGNPYVVTTGTNGEYLFANIDDGTYRVKFDLPTGYARTTQSNPINPLAGGADSDAHIQTGTTGTFNVAHGDNITTIDAGFIGASIEGVVWHDADADGINAGESVYTDGAVVKLLDASGNPVKDPLNPTEDYVVTTDASGAYKFENLPAGEYSVELVKPEGYQLSPMQDAGTDDAIDSDFAILTTKTNTITLESGEVKTSVDAGIYQPAMLAGVVWLDQDLNGTRADAENPFTTGMIVKLLDAEGNAVNNPLTGEAYELVTDASGAYSFENLPAGEYMVEFAVSNSYNISPQNTGDDATDSDINSSTKRTEVIALAEGDDSQNNDAGIRRIAMGGGPITLIKGVCRDESAINYISFGFKDNSICEYEPEEESTGEVLGVSTDLQCGEKITHYIKQGKLNNVADVRLLQRYLNEHEGEALAITAEYDDATLDAVKRYQAKYIAEILTPWGITSPTGYVFKTTITHINNRLACEKEEVTVVVELIEHKSCPRFKQKLAYGSFGESVRDVQRYMTELGFYHGPISGYYGVLTKSAVRRYQNVNRQQILVPWGINCPCGTGNWFQATITFANNSVGCNAKLPKLPRVKTGKSLRQCILKHIPSFRFVR